MNDLSCMTRDMGVEEPEPLGQLVDVQTGEIKVQDYPVPEEGKYGSAPYQRFGRWGKTAPFQPSLVSRGELDITEDAAFRKMLNTHTHTQMVAEEPDDPETHSTKLQLIVDKQVLLELWIPITTSGLESGRP